MWGTNRYSRHAVIFELSIMMIEILKKGFQAKLNENCPDFSYLPFCEGKIRPILKIFWETWRCLELDYILILEMVEGW